MNTAIQEHEWRKTLRFFNEQNSERPTRLGVFEPNREAAADYWLECGLPFRGIDIDPQPDRLNVQILVGSFEHEVDNAVKLSWHMTTTGDEDGLDIVDAAGRTTVLRFENPRS